MRYLQPGARILALSWDGEDAGQARRRSWTSAGMGASSMTVLEAHGRSERARALGRRPRASISARSKPLNTIALEVVGRDGCGGAQPCARPRRQPVRARRPAHQARGARGHRLGAGAAAGRAALGRRPGRGLDRHRMARCAIRRPRPSASRRRPKRAARARRAMPPRWARPIFRSCRRSCARSVGGICAAPDAVFIGGGLAQCRACSTRRGRR